MNAAPRPTKKATKAAAAAAALNARGLAAARAKRFEEAADWFAQAVAAQPNDPMFRTNLGGAYKALGRPAEAAEQHRAAIALAPSFAGAHYNLGNACVDMGAWEEAMAAFGASLLLTPEPPLARHNLALLQHRMGLADAALATLRDHLDRHPDDVGAWRNALLYSLYEPGLSAQDRFELHRQADARSPSDLSPIWANPPLGSPPRRLKIGVVSSDFRNHPVSRNYGPIFKHLDRRYFELTAYSLTLRPDRLTQAVRADMDRWREAAGRSDAEIAAMMRADGIDIALIVSGHFDDNRPLLGKRRPAPVVISIGDCGQGMSGIDYLISDPIMSPRPATEPYAERPLRAPNFYVHAPLVDAPDPGAPPKEIRFLSAHNPAKLNDAVLGVWGEILRRAPDAHLELRYQGAFANAALRRRVQAACGADVADRVVFGDAAPGYLDHLAAYRRARVALDPFPFNGATVTFEALWMGVPVVTLLGEAIHGRLTGSLLTQAGLTDCVVRSREDYIIRALDLARDEDRLRDLRQTLRGRVAASALCDPGKVAGWFGRLFRAAWRRYEKS